LYDNLNIVIKSKSIQIKTIIYNNN